MAAVSLRPLADCSVPRALASVVAKGRPGVARPATEAVGLAGRTGPVARFFARHKRSTGPFVSGLSAARRLPCGARLDGPAHNSLRSLRSLRSNRMRQKCLRGALRARAVNPALLGASHAGRAPPGRPFAATIEGVRRTPTLHPERQVVPRGRAVCGAEQRSLKGGARSALRKLTCRILFERSERSERSELCGTPFRRAAQGSRCAAPTDTACASAGHRLPRRAKAHPARN
jgi:hypothetical protein